jgi:phosphohistidine phosphatase
MKTLYLLRHAQAAPEAPLSMGDYDRVLSAKGEQEAQKVADYLKQGRAAPDFVLASSAARTLQTARIIMKAFSHVDSHFDRQLYLATPDIILRDIFSINDNVNSLLVVGHNPGIAELAIALSNRTFSDFSQDFPTATLAVLEGDFNAWSEISPHKLKLADVFLP